jgi:hypothetical protein
MLAVCPGTVLILRRRVSAVSKEGPESPESSFETPAGAGSSG